MLELHSVVCCTYPLYVHTYLSQAIFYSRRSRAEKRARRLLYYANKMLRKIKGMTNNRNSDL